MSDLNVTNIKLYQIQNKKVPEMLASATVTFNDVMSVNGLIVRTGSKGIFVAWPSRKIQDKYVGYVYLDGEIRDKVNTWILKMVEQKKFTERPSGNQSNYKKKSNDNMPDFSGSNAPNDDDLPF